MNARLASSLSSILSTTTTECWIWPHYIDKRGYGRLRWQKRYVYAHRVVAVVAGIIDNLDDKRLVCHKCDNPPCVNREHLYAGTHKTNVRDCIERKRHYWQNVTHCPQGHAYEGKNLFTAPRGNGARSRRCRICHLAQVKKAKKLQKIRRSGESHKLT